MDPKHEIRPTPPASGASWPAGPAGSSESRGTHPTDPTNPPGSSSPSSGDRGTHGTATARPPAEVTARGIGLEEEHAFEERPYDDELFEYERGTVRRPHERGRGLWRETSGIVRGLAHDLTTLVRKEAELVRTELSEKLDQVKAGVGEVGAGAIVTFAGLLTLLWALVLGIDVLVDELWISAAIVGGFVTIVGLALLGRGRANLRKSSLEPERSMRSLRKDADLVREETRRA